MSPRTYDMSKRAAAVARTRRRTVDATRELHTEQGIAATSWDDIAARAGVGVGTDALEARIERLVREAFAIYERGAPELRVVRDEPEAHPSVAEVGEALEASLSALVDAAGIEVVDRPVVRAMTDLGTWQALRDQGLGPAEAVDA